MSIGSETGISETHAASGKIKSLNIKDKGPRDWLSGFLLLGVLLGLIGSLLVAWQYHISTDPRLIGLHFLALNAGYVLAGWACRLLVGRLSIRWLALLACVLAAGSLIGLALLAPPALPYTRLLALSGLGFSAGILSGALFHALNAYYLTSPAQAINTAGTLFGCGCALATLVVGTTYFAGSIQLEIGLLAIIPLIFVPILLRSRYTGCRAPFVAPAEEKRMRNALKDVRSIAALLFALLLFFQFGNEWVIAGWLAIFLIHRLGANPVEAILVLAIHFSALTAARLAVRQLLPRVSHRKLLGWSMVVALAGYLALSLAPSIAVAGAAVILIGFGYAPIYPVLAETLDERFSYHPGFYQNIFSVAITGAMSAPWLVGFVDSWFGSQFIMLLPALGSIAVLLLALLIRLEARLMGSAGKQKSLSASA